MPLSPPRSALCLLFVFEYSSWSPEHCSSFLASVFLSRGFEILFVLLAAVFRHLGGSQSLPPYLSLSLSHFHRTGIPTLTKGRPRSPKSTPQSFCGHPGEDESFPTTPGVKSEAGLKTSNGP